MMNRRPNEEEAEDADKKPAKVAVCLVVSAEWPIKVQDAEALLVRAGELQDKIKAADLAGLKDEKPSEEEEEETEETKEEESEERKCPGCSETITDAEASECPYCGEDLKEE